MKNNHRRGIKPAVSLLLCFAMLVSFCGCQKEDEPQKVSAMAVADAADAIVQLEDASELYGYENALSELSKKNTSAVDGDHYYRLQQNYKGIPVYGRTVVCAADENGNVTSLTGNVLDITDEIDLRPTVSADQLEGSVRAFFMEDGDRLPDDWHIRNLTETDLCIYVENDAAEAHLAYCVHADAYEFIIDAHDGRILSAVPTLFVDQAQTVEGTIESDRRQVFPVEKQDDDTYIMHDTARKLRVYTLNYQSSGDGTGINHNLATLIQSADTVFGNTEEEIRLEQEKGAALYQKAIFIHDYFDKLNFVPVVDGVYLYYNDQFWNGENALGGILEIDNIITGVVAMGSEKNGIDTVGHEYTHYVSRNIVNWRGGDETGALNEAMSDLFGEFIESAYKSAVRQENVDPDWVHGRRNMINPSRNGYPEKVTDKNLGGEDFTHGYSTVITHAAYRMWNGIDGKAAKKISTEDLAKLWYRAMLMMPATCDFSDCGQYVALAAESMGLTNAQVACIREALKEAGLLGSSEEEDTATYKISRGGRLYVYGPDGMLCDNYTLVMAQKKLVDLGSGGVRITRKITSADPYDLSGLTEGKYTFTITDGANADNSMTFTVSVKDGYQDSEIEIATNFGGAFVTGCVVAKKEIDGKENQVPVTNAIVTIYAHDTGSVVETFDLSQGDGFFQSLLPMGNYSVLTQAKGYISMTNTFAVTSQEKQQLLIVLDPNPSLVTDAYTKSCTYTARMYNYETQKSEEKEITCTYRIPRINLYSDAVEQINSEIYDALYPVIEDAVKEITEYGFPYTSEEISYRWAMNGNILSLVICNSSVPDFGGGKTYIVCNIDLSSEKKLSDVSLIQNAGFSEETYRERAREVLGTCFWSGWNPSDESFQSQSFVDFFNEQLNRTISDENIRQSYPYLNEKGQLCIIAKKYALAAGDYYWNDLNMIVFEKVPHYADQAQKLPEPTEAPKQTEAPNPDPTDPPAEESGGITVQELVGEWIVDTDYTMKITGLSMWDLYGTSFSDGGNKMTFRADGTYQYYVAWCYGNGSFDLQNGEILVNLKDGDPLTGAVRLIITREGILRIGLDQYGDGNLVYWKKA